MTLCLNNVKLLLKVMECSAADGALASALSLGWHYWGCI